MFPGGSFASELQYPGSAVNLPAERGTFERALRSSPELLRHEFERHLEWVRFLELEGD